MLYLASASPRRRDLLTMLGLTFEICPAKIDETMDPSAPPAEEVERVARRKAEAAKVPAGGIVIAADTIVVCQGQVLGKPSDTDHARQMLHLLSGRDHQVLTGIAVRRGTELKSHVETTLVHVRSIREDELEAYLATGESLDKAGAYGIQGRAGLFCSGISEDYYNVMGLPLCALGELLRSFGVQVL